MCLSEHSKRNATSSSRDMQARKSAGETAHAGRPSEAAADPEAAQAVKRAMITSCITMDGALADSLQRCMRWTEGRCKKSSKSAIAASQATSKLSRLMRVNRSPAGQVAFSGSAIAALDGVTQMNSSPY